MVTPCDATPLGLHDRHVRCKWSHAGLPKALPLVNASAVTLIHTIGGLRDFRVLVEAAGCKIEKMLIRFVAGSFLDPVASSLRC